MNIPLFTPGPWRIWEFDQTEDHLIQIRSTPADVLVAAAIHEHPTEPTEEECANAILVAHAPELLDSCIRLVECVNQVIGVLDSGREISGHIDSWRKAAHEAGELIDQALGKTPGKEPTVSTGPEPGTTNSIE